MLQKEIAMCGFWRQGTDVLESTSEAHISSTVSNWASQQKSSIVVISGNAQSTKSLRYLSCQIVNHLHVQNYATICILNNADLRGHFKNLGPDELLRQIACQLLKMITKDLTISLLVEILQCFHAASATEHWFRLLDQMMQKLTSLFVVIDTSVLEEHAKKAGLWVTEFSKLFRRSGGTWAAYTKVMILTNREVDIASEDCLHVHIGSKTNRTFPRNSPRPTPSRRYTEISLPFLIPAATRMDSANDNRQSLSHQNDSCLETKEVEQQLSVTTVFLATKILITLAVN